MKFSLQSTVLFLLIGIACTATTTTTATAASATEAQNRVRSIRVSGRIASNDVLKFPVELGTNTRVVLDLDPKMSVPVQADGRFTFGNVAVGSAHTVSVEATNFRFPKLHLVVMPDELVRVYPVVPGVEWTAEFAEPLEDGLLFKAVAKIEYFNARPSSASLIQSVIANPMMLLMGLSILLMFVMPKMMENMQEGMTEEELKEMRESQAKMQQLMGGGGGGNFMDKLAEAMAGGQSASQQQEQEANRQQVETKKNTSGKKKK